MSDQPQQPPVLGPMLPVPWPPPAADPLPDTAPAPRPAPAAEPEPTVEEKRARAMAKKAGEYRRQAGALRAAARRWAIAVILISGIITVFGSGNAHDVLARHNTPEPWGWFLYPALEAGLIVEIQIGGALAEQSKRVEFWGAALRVVTALAAITVCVYGPAENGDLGGAILHAIGPTVQFFLAEFLAAARARFKAAVEELEAKAARTEGREPVQPERRQETGKKRSPKTAGSKTKTVPETEESDAAGDRPSDPGTGPEVVLTPNEKKALAAIQRKGLRVSKRTVIDEVRAVGGAIGTTRALLIAREWGPVPGGPHLSVVDQKEA